MWYSKINKRESADAIRRAMVIQPTDAAQPAGATQQAVAQPAEPLRTVARPLYGSQKSILRFSRSVLSRLPVCLQKEASIQKQQRPILKLPKHTPMCPNTTKPWSFTKRRQRIPRIKMQRSIIWRESTDCRANGERQRAFLRSNIQKRPAIS